MRDEMRAGFDKIGDNIADINTDRAVAAEQRKTFIDICKQNQEDITSIKRQSNRLDAGVLIISGIWSTIIALASGNR